MSPGHALLITKRHVSSWFEASTAERAELLEAIEVARRQIELNNQPNGFNIGVNVGEAAGQTVNHLHLHVIPRYAGDHPDPRGGIRAVIPGKRSYLAPLVVEPSLIADREPSPIRPDLTGIGTAPHSRGLIAGGHADPLLPHLHQHLDQAHQVDLVVSFLKSSGLTLIREHLYDLVSAKSGRNGYLRFLTGAYMDVTEPEALEELLDLQAQYPDHVGAWLFDAPDTSFHPKAYLFSDVEGSGIAIIGSSNLSRSALTHGIEWNLRTTVDPTGEAFRIARRAFDDLLSDPRVYRLTPALVAAYRQRRVPQDRKAGIEPEPPPLPPTPHSIQGRALVALEGTRADGNAAGLVVLATGLGKTFLSAFDSNRTEYRRVLFVAHREEILRQAMETFRRVRPNANLGFFTGKEKLESADVLFASVLTLARHLARFAADRFDYIVIDEFHHAAAGSYRRVIDHFEPKFLLGLTATPERTDGGDLLALCQENLIFRCDLAEGIEAGLLCPFHYFGVPDEVDYQNIPWRNRRFDPEELTRAVATQARAQNALEQYRLRAGSRTLAFCCSTLHANFMRDFFRDANLRVAAVHSEAATSDPRAGSLERLERGELDIVFAVDMFNEGVDVPDIDTIMMLRPTESRILWLQQFGRGLRHVEGKTLHVIDYIGNHRTFLLRPQMLLNAGSGDAGLQEALNLLAQGKVYLPPGCEVTYELEALDILRKLLRLPQGDEAVRFFYQEFREFNGSRPTAAEMYHEGYNPRSARRVYDSWFGFVRAMGDLDADEQQLTGPGAAGDFLRELEATPMTKSYKMLVLRALLESEALPGELPVETLADRVRRVAERSARLKAEFDAADSDKALIEQLETNPIEAWVAGKGTGGRSYFGYDGQTFRSTFPVQESLVPAFRELVREIVDWRLAEYLDRQPPDRQDGVPTFVCRVSQSSGRPILFLPNRKQVPFIPDGWTTVQTGLGPLELNFVKIAVNVARRSGEEGNVLPDLLQKWFGEQAGQPGTLYQVRFENRDGVWHVEPAGTAKPVGGPEVGRSYARAEIPPLFGLEARGRIWDQGFLRAGGQIFLLVTLDKEGMPSAHQYQDRFHSPELFEWKSQNQTSRRIPSGQSIQNHAREGVPVHLFVRKSGKIGGKGAPFVYCGTLQFQRWEGDNPITVWWKLETPLSQRVAGLFDVPRQEVTDLGGGTT